MTTGIAELGSSARLRLLSSGTIQLYFIPKQLLAGSSAVVSISASGAQSNHAREMPEAQFCASQRDTSSVVPQSPVTETRCYKELCRS